MASESTPLHTDPEFRPATSPERLPPVIFPGRYRLILLNPSGLILVLWVISLGFMLNSDVLIYPQLILLTALVAALGFSPWLIQYHCLDCGRTGPIVRWRHHLCPKVAQRILQNRPRSRFMPSPLVQAFAWTYLLLAIFFKIRPWDGSPR